MQLWYGVAAVASTETDLQRLQRAACIMNIGTMRKTLPKVTEMFPDLPVLSMATEATAFNCSVPCNETRSKGCRKEA